MRSLVVPCFNTCYTKDSTVYRGSVLWNAMTNNFSALANDRVKLTSLISFNEFNFKTTSASTSTFRKDEFVYS